MLFIRIQQILSRSKDRRVYIPNSIDFIKKIGKILFFGKSGKLRDVIEAHIDYPFYPSVT